MTARQIVAAALYWTCVALGPVFAAKSGSWWGSAAYVAGVFVGALQGASHLAWVEHLFCSRVIPCSSCGQKNRVRPQPAGKKPVCGNCRAPL